jgi:hypothetical protein
MPLGVPELPLTAYSEMELSWTLATYAKRAIAATTVMVPEVEVPPGKEVEPMVNVVVPMTTISVASTVDVPVARAVARPELVMLAGTGAVVGEIVKTKLEGFEAGVAGRPSLQISCTANCCVAPTASVTVVGRLLEAIGIELTWEAVMMFRAIGAGGVTVRMLGVVVGGTVTQ